MITINETPCFSAVITFPYIGRWTANLSVDGEVTSGPCVLDGLTGPLVGTATVRTWAGRSTAFVVGGTPTPELTAQQFRAAHYELIADAAALGKGDFVRFAGSAVETWRMLGPWRCADDGTVILVDDQWPEYEPAGEWISDDTLAADDFAMRAGVSIGGRKVVEVQHRLGGNAFRSVVTWAS